MYFDNFRDPRDIAVLSTTNANEVSVLDGIVVRSFTKSSDNRLVASAKRISWDIP